MATNKRKEPGDKQDELAAPSRGQPPVTNAEPALASTVPASGRRYIVFDQATGAIVGTYSHLNADTGKFDDRKPAEILTHFADMTRTAKGAKRADAPALAVMAVDEETALGLETAGVRVDPKSKQLVPRSRFKLTADRTAITGDGKDSVDITVTAVDAEGKADAHFTGEVRVSTNHGRLSERGGVVTLKKGVGHITLTSTPETIARVTVTARDEQRLVANGALDLEFL
ncbi:MAG TPA: hypothetical protein VFI52_05510 [Gemmatimonadaceae bacterium]|nr:hypothetical protein [Gemmatimonadaceae bacterium]